ncbi:MAG TPA: DUF2637 domain-containing protein [Streptosporangiaceae bacterium]|jgi:hypothetical protein|nr:DUF2637 domain-containing protein [Streptosporangiaceae bacterium]
MTQHATRPTSAQIAGAACLGLLVTGIIVVAFRGSWGALRDAALAAHFDRNAAGLYPFAVDGLLVVAIVAAVLLRHDRGARRYCLGIIGGYTVASWLINFLHGLGMFLADPATGKRPVPPWPVVVVIATLVIASIFLGSHLLVFVWRHLYPTTGARPEAAEVSQGATPASQDATPRVELPPTNLELAKAAFRESLAPDRQRLSQRALVERYGIKARQAAKVQDEVNRELTAEHAAPSSTEATDVAAQHTPNGRVDIRDGAGGR